MVGHVVRIVVRRVQGKRLLPAAALQRFRMPEVIDSHVMRDTEQQSLHGIDRDPVAQHARECLLHKIFTIIEGHSLSGKKPEQPGAVPHETLTEF